MLSVIHYGGTHCIHNSESEAWRKSTYLKPYTPWVDMIIAVILITIGTLALHGVIPMSGAQIMIAVGSLQLLIGASMKICEYSKGCWGAARGFFQERDG